MKNTFIHARASQSVKDKLATLAKPYDSEGVLLEKLILLAERIEDYKQGKINLGAFLSMLDFGFDTKAYNDYFINANANFEAKTVDEWILNKIKSIEGE